MRDEDATELCVDVATETRDEDATEGTEDCVDEATAIRDEDATEDCVDEAAATRDEEATGDCTDETTAIREDATEDCVGGLLDDDRIVDTVTEGVIDEKGLKTLFKTVSSYAFIPVHAGIVVRSYEEPRRISNAGAM